jgi:hypothetical protein
MESSWTPLEIVLAAVSVLLALAIGVILITRSNWVGLAAVGMVGVVLWAVYHQGILEWLGRPKLEMMPFEMKPPLFQKAPEYHPNTSQRVGSRFCINVQIRNTGETSAKSCQPVVTAMGKFDAGEWQEKEDWIPVSLEWALDESSNPSLGKPKEERDLVPQRPYHFNLGSISTTDPHAFKLLLRVGATAQEARFLRGQYCFEVTVFAEKAKPVTKYFHVKWVGGCTDGFEEVLKRIKVFADDYSPW